MAGILTFKWLKVSTSFNFFFFHDPRQSESTQVNPSLSHTDWRSKFIRSNFCTCLLSNPRWQPSTEMCSHDPIIHLHCKLTCSMINPYPYIKYNIEVLQALHTSLSSLSCSFLFSRSSFFLTFLSFFSSCLRSFKRIKIHPIIKPIIVIIA